MAVFAGIHCSPQKKITGIEDSCFKITPHPIITEHDQNQSQTVADMQN